MLVAMATAAAADKDWKVVEKAAMAKGCEVERVDECQRAHVQQKD